MNIDIQGVLFPNGLTMLVQLCSTIVLFLLCKKLLWTPARNILKKRQEKIDGDLQDAKKLQEEAVKALDDAKENLVEARNKSNEIVHKARQEADDLKKLIIADAKKEAVDKIKEAERKIENEKQEAKKEIHDEMVTVAMAAVSKLLNEKADNKQDEEAIKEYIKEVKKD